jgi:hypothetical protein
VDAVDIATLSVIPILNGVSFALVYLNSQYHLPLETPRVEVVPTPEPFEPL